MKTFIKICKDCKADLAINNMDTECYINDFTSYKEALQSYIMFSLEMHIRGIGDDEMHTFDEHEEELDMDLPF